jgi:hypothetical protein
MTPMEDHMRVSALANVCKALVHRTRSYHFLLGKLPGVMGN